MKINRKERKKKRKMIRNNDNKEKEYRKIDEEGEVRNKKRINICEDEEKYEDRK